MDDLCRMTLVDVAHAIHQKKVSSLDVTKACLDRLERLQPDLNCFLSHEPDGALAAAHAADVAVARGNVHGPLHGVPLAHKDIFHRQGDATTCGSRLPGRRVADSTATVLARLSAAGAISLGTLNLSQLCYNPYGFNDDFGRCRNPWKLDRISGGSSSGSASAVAGAHCFRGDGLRHRRLDSPACRDVWRGRLVADAHAGKQPWRGAADVLAGQHRTDCPHCPRLCSYAACDRRERSP